MEEMCGSVFLYYMVFSSCDCACCDDVYLLHRNIYVHLKSSCGVVRAENQFCLLDTIDRR